MRSLDVEARDGSIQAPLVSVIVPTYNDQDHVVEAVTSLQLQSLKNIEIIVADDCSTDGTADAIRAVMQSDPRVRYLKLPENTGGAGAPRNRALDIAAGKYTMYLDSDDVLDRHACMNLVRAAESEGAEVAAGLTVRHYTDTGRRERWYGHLYESTRVFDTIDDFPELSHDTLITNKAFRTDFLRREGLKFPEDMHYEDVIFAAQMYSVARGYVVIPELVYQWNVYPSDIRQSITNQRSFRRNLDDRLKAIEAVERAFQGHSDALTYELGQKILTHHLRLYINDIQFMDDGDAAATLEAVRQVAQRVSPHVFRNIRLPLRLLYGAAFSDSLSGVREALSGLQRGAFPGVVVRGRGSALWTPGGAGTELRPADEWSWLLDLTDDHLLRVPHSQFDYLHRLTGIRQLGGGKYELQGEFKDPLGKVNRSGAEVELLYRAFSGEELQRYPVTLGGTDNHHTWSVEINAPRRRGLSDGDGRTFDVRVELSDGAVSVRPLYADIDGDFTGFADPSTIGRTLGDKWVFTSGPNEKVELQIRSDRAMAKFVRGSSLAVQVLKSAVGKTVAAVAKATGPESVAGQKVVYPLMRMLPLDRNLVFFESNLGLAANDSPFAVYKSASTTHRETLKFTWSLDAHADKSVIDVRDKIVRRKSYAYYYSIARASYFVDNQSLPANFSKRPGQRYLQTWHGIPLKKMGKDEPRFANSEAAERLERVSSTWDLLNIPSPYFESTFVPAYGYKNEKLRWGTPRNDELIAPTRSAVEVRRSLDIPNDVKVVLYAPTFRESQRSRARATKLMLNVSDWAERFRDEYVLLVRAHYLNRFVVPDAVKGAVVDVSSHPNVSELYHLADALITDFSSVMFDYALLDKPIICFAPDYDDYVARSRGIYFNLREEAPGPVVESQDELFMAIGEMDSSGISERHAEFVRKYCGIEDGKSSERSLLQLLKDRH